MLRRPRDAAQLDDEAEDLELVEADAVVVVMRLS
jgi:hypothetical protein